MSIAFSPVVRTVLCDLDGTLANVEHRLHHVKITPPNWDGFFADMDKDPFNLAIGEMIEALHRSGYEVIICTGRPEKYREVTAEWLAAYGVLHTLLMMRPDGDFRPDHVVKSEMLGKIRTLGFEPFIVFDDRPSVIRMWRDHGLEVLQVKGHDDALGCPDTARLDLMVGPSGAGKTSWLKGTLNVSPLPHELGILPWHVVSTDELRNDIVGDWMSQEMNDQVFRALHELVSIRLRHGLPVCVDATNIRNKDRKAVVELAPSSVRVRYIVINRPLSDKRESGGWRNTLDVDLIGRHDHTFRSNLPDILSGDGFPNVTVVDLRKGGIMVNPVDFDRSPPGEAPIS